MPKTLDKSERVGVYLFAQMCSHSAAGHADIELERWYEDGLDFYNSITLEVSND